MFAADLEPLMGFGFMLSSLEKFTIYLQYCRTNSFHRDVGTQFHVRVSQSTATRVVNKVAGVIGRAVNEVSTYIFVSTFLSSPVIWKEKLRHMQM